MQQSGVELRERMAFSGLRVKHGRVTGVETADAGVIATEHVILTGGPQLRRVGKLAGTRVWAGGARHQIAVTEPHEAFEYPEWRLPMIFDLGAGLYWRQEEQGLLFGMSNPNEAPGKAREIDWPYLRRMQRRLAKLVPATAGLGLRKAWAATIDYTPDHMPILGPALHKGGEPIDGTVVASPGGHGMMWGPAVAKVAADLATAGSTDLVDVSDLGLDRFDGEGHSRLATDPIALPFPVSADDEDDE
jgi:sarcosine oxidase subunit beta